MAQHKLVIAEKPSVAQSLAAVIGATVRKDGYLVLSLALLGGGGVFAYLKLVKNKPKTKGNDSLDDYDYGEEDSEEWETEDEESDEPDADGGSTEEDDEDSVK